MGSLTAEPNSPRTHRTAGMSHSPTPGILSFSLLGPFSTVERGGDGTGHMGDDALRGEKEKAGLKSGNRDLFNSLTSANWDRAWWVGVNTGLEH